MNTKLHLVLLPKTNDEHINTNYWILVSIIYSMILNPFYRTSRIWEFFLIKFFNSKLRIEIKLLHENEIHAMSWKIEFGRALLSKRYYSIYLEMFRQRKTINMTQNVRLQNMNILQCMWRERSQTPAVQITLYR